MVQSDNRQQGVLRSLDWWTIGIYLALLTFGWISVCGASYTYGDNDIFSLGSRSGMQIIWIGTSITLGFIILLLDDRFYDTFSYVIYAALVLLLFGGKKLPEMMKGLGQGVRSFKDGMKDVSDENVHEPQSSQQMQATDEASDKNKEQTEYKKKENEK